MDDYSSFFQASAPLVSAGVQAVGTKLKYKYTKQLQDEQNAFNLQMWNLQNEYNSPQAQMQRFKEAGLNPNLIYGQGTSGNATSAPVQGVPDAPDYTPAMKELSELFNIENLRTIRAHRKKAEADADNARTNADRNAMDFDSDMVLGATYDYNPDNGQFFRMPVDAMYTIRNQAASDFYSRRKLAENYRGSHLIPYRAALYDWQKRYLVPQVQMLNFERGKQPVTYWVNTVGKGIRSAADVIGIFQPKNWFVPRTSFNPYSNY